MADLSLRAESVPVTLPHDLIPIKLPPVLAYIVGCDIAPRIAVERLIQKAIDALDELDGDPDREDDDANENDDPREDDDPSGQCDEDGMNTADGQAAYSLHGMTYSGAGCPISDPGGEEEGQHMRREYEQA